MFQENRRFALVLCVFLLTMFFVCSFSLYNIIFPAVLLGLTAVCFISRFISAVDNKIKRTCGFLLVLLIPVLAATFFCAMHHNISEKSVLDYLEKYKDTPVYIKAEITNASSSTYMSMFDLKVYEVSGEKVKKFNLNLTITGEIGAGPDEIDDILETYVLFKSLEDDLTSDSSLFYFKSGGYYIAADYVAGVINDDDENDSYPFKIIPVKSHSLTYYLHAMRNYARDTFFKNIKYDFHDTKTQEAALVYGIFTGDKSYINPTVKTDFKKSGISHVLAVSGLHLSILCGIIFSFLNLLKVHKKITCAVIIFCCLVFMAFTGFSLSVIRSGIMMILFYSAFLIGRKSDSLTSLLFAGIFIVFLNPYNILNIGFQLSFAATLGIVMTTGLNNKIMAALNNIKRFQILAKLLKIVASSFIITIAATIFTLPFISYSFKTLSLISPVTNLLTAPLITAVLFLALCIMLFSFIPFVLGIFSFPAYFTAKLLLDITNWLGSFKYAYISVESTNGTGFYIFAIVFLVLVILCFLFAASETSTNPVKKLIKPAVYSVTALAFLMLCGTLIYPRIIFNDSLKFAYYSDNKNQNIILFQKDYDSADIIDITHGTQAHIKPVYDIILENGAVHINSIILTDYRKRHVQMIKKYMTYSDVKRVYIPEPYDDYDIEVLNMLYYLSVSADFELVKYGNALKLDHVLITVNNFDYNKMRHMTVVMDYKNINKILYLGIGYKEGYAEYTDVKNYDYDIVFYGSHKHNRRDDNYVSDIYGSYAGVLSSYLDGDKNKTSQKIEASALENYLSGSVLFRSDDYGSIVFEIDKNDRIKHYLK